MESLESSKSTWRPSEQMSTLNYNFVLKNRGFTERDSASDTEDCSSTSSSCALYTLSDISSLSSNSGKDKTDIENQSKSNETQIEQSLCQNFHSMSFLPPVKSVSQHKLDMPKYGCNEDCRISLASVKSTVSDNSTDEGFCDRNSHSGSLASFSMHKTQPKNQELNNFDFEGMKEKLEAQKEYLLGTFQKQTHFPQSLPSTQPKYPKQKVSKHCFKFMDNF